MNKFKLRIYYEGELVALWIVNEKQKKIIEEVYNKENANAITLPEDRIFCIDHTGNSEIAKYASEKGYRINRAMEYEGDLVLKF